jgi:hypothetical protein
MIEFVEMTKNGCKKPLPACSIISLRPAEYQWKIGKIREPRDPHESAVGERRCAASGKNMCTPPHAPQAHSHGKQRRTPRGVHAMLR